MATDVNQTIQDSRKAAMSFLDAAKAKENARKNKEGVPSPKERTRAFNERFNAREYQRAKQAGPEAMDQYWKEEKDRQDMEKSRRAASDFLNAGRRNEERAAAAQNGEETGFDLHDRVSHMSDEEFDRGVADGTITPEQIRKAGQEAYENYMLDVWSETDQAEDMPWPSYEEFMENPEKYGYTSINDDSEYPDRFERYKPSRYQKQ